ncbi:hypothetical protein D3C86_1567260 [compost metagenome]
MAASAAASVVSRLSRTNRPAMRPRPKPMARSMPISRVRSATFMATVCWMVVRARAKITLPVNANTILKKPMKLLYSWPICG